MGFMKLFCILFTHGKYAWASNMDSIEFNSYLCEMVVINYQKGGD
jgi:hypothetical protein